MRRWTARHRGWTGILVFAALALVALFAYRTLFKAGSASTVSYVTQAAETGTLVVSVSATGNVALGQTHDVVPAVTGVVRGLTVKVGDAVTEGQVLFTLENAQLDAGVTSAKAGYNQAKASLYNAEIQVEQAEQSLEQLRDAADNAGSDSTTPPTTAPPTTHPPTSRPPTSSTAPPTTSPPTTLPPTTVPPTTAPPPTSDPPTTAPPTTPPVTDPSVALVRDGAQPQAVVALAGPGGGTTTATTASTGQQTAAVTEDDLEIAEKQVAAAQASLAAARANLTNADFSLQQAKATADERTVTAPAAGTITVLSAQEGLSLGSSSAGTSSSQASGAGAGSGAQSSQSAVTIVDPGSISVVVQLNEVDIPQVKVGQKTTLTFDALPDLTLTGAVTVVDVAGTVSQGVVTYNVTVVPDTVPDQVRAGMTASASIVTNVHQDVVLVPSAAVKTDTNGGSYVQLLVNGTPQQRTVEVGLTNDTSTEIVTGLAAGDRVVTQTVDPNATQTTLRSGQGGFGGAGGFLPGGGGPPGGR